MHRNKHNFIILAAGEGKRLRPYTNEIPKCMVQIAGRSLIDWQLDIIQSFESFDINLVGGYKGEKLKKFNFNILLNENFANTNMVYTLFCAEEKLSDRVVISYGDIVYSREILSAVDKFDGEIGVVADLSWRSYWEKRNENPLDDAESFKVSKEGLIYDLGHKVSSYDEIEAQYIGLIKFTKNGVQILKDVYARCVKKGIINNRDYKNAYMTDLLQEIINLGYPVTPIFTNAPWIEVDTVKDLLNDVTISRLKSITSDLGV